MKQTLSNTAIGALIGLANTILYTILFPFFLSMESFMAFFSFDGSFWWIMMLAFGYGIAMLGPNMAVGAVIGMLVSLPRYYWSARFLVTLLALFSSAFIFRVFLYEGNLIDAIVEGAMHYIGSIVVTTVFYTYAFNKWIINPSRRMVEPVEE